MKTPFHKEHRGIAARFPRTSARGARLEALDKSDIAELNTTVINSMTCDELVRTIRAAGLLERLCPNLTRRLPFYDHATLTRLAHLAQRCCNHGKRPQTEEAE